MPQSMRPCVRTSRHSPHRSTGALPESSRRRSRAETAIANSCSGRGVTESLAITRLGHRGDGVADTPGGPVFVPYALPGETVEVEAVPGHPERRHLLRIENASAQRVTPVCPHFGLCGGCQT